MRNNAANRFDEFLYAPVDPLPLGLFRIALGVVLLFRFFTLCLDFNPLFTPDSITSLDAARAFGTSSTGEVVPYYRWSLFHVSDTMIWARFLFVLYGVSIVAFLLGWRTRLASLLVFVLTVSVHRREPVIWVGGDTIIQCVTFWLLFVPAGAALSLDAHRRKLSGHAPPVVHAWALLLLQGQVALLYLSTFLLKLESPPWLDGTALRLAWQLPFFERSWNSALVGIPWLVAAATWGTLAFEGAFPLLVWFRRFRPWLLSFAVVFHVVIELTLRITIFSYAMLACYVPFLPASTLRDWIGRLGVLRVQESRAENDPAMRPVH